MKRPLRKYRHRWEIILKWILKCGWLWTKVLWFRTGESYCEYCNKSLGVVKAGEFLDQLSECVSKKKSFSMWIYAEAIEGGLMT